MAKKKDTSKQNDLLNELLENHSFKIKPIILELKNYSYYHSTISDNDDDYNKRFIGRSNLITKIKSFVLESSKNTGTYLISGFRGMGKTSLVNKALSSLNPKSKTREVVLLWLLLLPLILIKQEYLLVFSKTPNLIGLGIFIAIFLFFQYQTSSRKKIYENWSEFFKNLVYPSLFKDFFYPNYQREKYTFMKNYRFLLIYLIAIFSFSIIFDCKNITSEHDKFWLITLTLFIIYLFIDLIKETFKLFKKESKTWFIIDSNIIIISSIISISIFRIIYCLFNVYQFILITFTLLIIGKLIIKYLKVNKKNIKYTTVFSRFLSFINFKQHLIVNINLGKDQLTEKDVLKYITNELNNVYKKWYYNFTNYKRLINITVISLIYFLILNGIYDVLPEDYRYNIINKEFNASRYFPSQIFLDKDNKKLDINNYLSELDSIKKSKKNYIKYSKNYNVGFTSIKTNLIQDSIIKIYFDSNNTKKAEEKSFKKITPLRNNILKHIAKITNTLDYFFIKTYIFIRNTVFSKNIDEFSKDNSFAKIIVFTFPKTPPLLVYIIFILTIIIYRFIPSRFIPFNSHLSSLKELKKLQQQIDASIIVEKNTNPSSGVTSIFNFRRTTSYQPLESKDISLRLIHILDNINKIKPFFTCVQFIIIFDELDKINSNHNISIKNKDDEFNVKDENRFQARRKERINKILSSMKYFLNTAKVKSIFIAGREMYDASLAGISDRESSLDSIFNDNKIYVNSFYKEPDDNNIKDITSITEQYVCQFLIPEDYKNEKNEIPDLKMYNQFLIDTCNSRKNNKIEELKRLKTITTLKNFIKYLTYRSNGAPRKLSNLFDYYTKSFTKKELIDNEKIIYADNSQSMCLNFSYYDQYKFSFISYLVTPIFLGLGNHMSDYSDKLLVSISYMLDHLFKHHKFGISFRSLTLTPEIIDVNKEPEFRNFLDKLIEFLSKNHLRRIISGVYDYRFQGKIAAELKLLSKINELEAAAFNFTLDESIELKRHFHKKIKLLEEKYKSDISVNNSTVKKDNINTISLLYMQLGDLHFNDEEFGDAIEQYLEAIQILRQYEAKEMRLYEFIIFVRNKLKLGLAFEKNKMYDNAQMTYSELTDLILQKRNIPIRKLGLVRFVVKRESIDFYKILLNNKKIIFEFLKDKQLNSEDLTDLNEIKNCLFEPYRTKINKDRIPTIRTNSHFFKYIKLVENYLLKNNTFNDIIIVGRPEEEIVREIQNTSDWKKLYSFKKLKSFYGFNDEYLIKNIDHLSINYKPLKRHYSLTASENIRIFYQPIIAKLHLIEKSSPNRINDIDIIRSLKEFSFYKRPLKTELKRVIVAEFYNKIGDFMYYKNGTLQNTLKQTLLKNLDENKKNLLSSPIDSLVFYTKSIAILLIPLHRKKNEATYSKINTFEYYKISESDNLKAFFDNINNTVNEVIKTLDNIKTNNAYRHKYSNEYLNSIANGLIDLAGASLSFVDNNNVKVTVRMELKKCIKLYYHANLIYKRIGEHRLAKSQLVKILHILKDKKNNTSVNLTDIEGDLMVETIVNSCIKYIYRSYNQSTRPEIKKMRIKLGYAANNFKNVYKSTTIMAEIEEILHLYHLLYLKSAQNWESNKNMFESNENDVEKVYSYTYKNTNPFSNINKKQNRILELSLRLKVNKKLFTMLRSNLYQNNLTFLKYLNISFKRNLNDESLKENLQKFLIIDSIGACNEIINSHNLFDANYITTTNLSLAVAHTKMGYWCNEFESIKTDQLIEKVKKIINSKNLMFLSTNYHYDIATQYNYKVKNFHNRGIPLDNFLKNNSYLDDFYNDNLIHFSIALERNNLHETIDSKIKNDSKSDTNVNDYTKYFY